MNYIEKNRLVAAIDWLKIEVSIARPTNLKAMRRALANILDVASPYVDVPGGDNNSATVFRFRIQDPEKMMRVRAVLARLGAIFPFALPPTVVAVEIALDNYGGGPEQVVAWYRGLGRIASDNMRLYRNGKGSGKAIPSNQESFVRHLRDGFQIGIGDQDGDCYQHAYFKTYDNGCDLEQSQHRARYEIRLQGSGLPCASLDDWGEFKFETLAPWFRFRGVKEGLSEFEQMVLDAQRQIGERKPRNRKEGGTRLYTKGTTAALYNEQVRNALRTLSRRWMSAERGRPKSGEGRIAKPGQDVACGNSGNNLLGVFNQIKGLCCPL